MGVDIYGRKPKTVSEKPDQIDYHTATDDEKQKYWNKVADWQETSFVGAKYSAHYCCN